jgi:asparagine synthase (glutamine-hydrolysing)
MCGIAGYIGSSIPEQVRVENCLAQLRRRGPDMQGLAGLSTRREAVLAKEWTPALAAADFLFLHTRLSILDLSESGRQPMADPRGNVISFNGEIYNYLEIRKELAVDGHVFSTGTDTEVILAAYAKWGAKCVERFNGMWAFALYDAVRRIVFLSRDRLGVKPIYFSRPDAASLVFASEIPALYALTGAEPTICRERLGAVFKSGLTDEGADTIFKGTRELRGGENAVFDLAARTWSVSRHWSLPEEPDLEISQDEALERFTFLFEDAVRLRFRADVPIALTCSGGVDSTAVAIATAKLGKDVTMFTSHLPLDQAIDESAFARTVADALKLPLVSVRPDIGQWKDEVTELSRAQAMPYGSLSLYVHWALLKEIRARGMPIVLSGQGADEVFFGYERYYSAFLAAQLPNPMKLIREYTLMRKRSLRGTSSALAFMAYFGMPRLQLMRRSIHARSALRTNLLDVKVSAPARFTTDRRHLQRMELLDYNLPRLLRYDDRTAGALGMETRLPFLDYRLVEFAHRLPWRHTFAEGWTKFVVRKYVAQNGIPEIAWRKGKLGFEAPTDRWVQELAAERWQRYRQTEFAGRLLKEGMDISSCSPDVRWGVFNVLELAFLHKWRLD